MNTYPRYKRKKNTKKVLFHLDPDERMPMYAQILNLVGDRLADFKASGVKFCEIADEIGVPKTRISEIYRKKYIGESTLTLLLSHKYIHFSDFMALELTKEQRKVLFDFLATIEPVADPT